MVEPWEPHRDFLIGHCGKSEIEAERTGWVELRALQKAHRERQYDAWRRTRLIAHSVYLYAPVFGKGVHKETDPHKFYPLDGDDEIEAKKELPVTHLTNDDIKELNRIKNLIR